MYSFVRQGLHDESGKTDLLDSKTGRDVYKSYKCGWETPKSFRISYTNLTPDSLGASGEYT